MSTSHDTSVRVWNVNTLECVEHMTTNDPVIGAGFFVSSNRLYTNSAEQLTLWMSNQLQLDFAMIGQPVRTIIAFHCICAYIAILM